MPLMSVPSRWFATRSAQFGEAGEDFLREHRQVGDGVVVIEEAALPHHQEVTEAADMAVERL